ncbi:hypothetical protein [Nocardioides pacificus]
MKQLPVPIRFELPGPDWEAVAPESVGVENAAFLAMRRNTGDDYTPSITIRGGWRPDPVTLVDIADETVAEVRAQAGDAELVRRQELGTEHAPAVNQVIGTVVSIDGRTHDLRQLQTITGLVDVDDPRKRIVLVYTLTCTYAQFEAIGREFQDFMRTVRVSPDDVPA